MRTIVIGDVHGCYDELMELLERLNWNPSSDDPDMLVFAGDLVDRGPKSQEVVAWVREAQQKYGFLVQAVMGNHDKRYPRYSKALKRQADNSKNTSSMRMDEHKLAVFNSLAKEDLTFIESLPGYLRFGNWVVVHAGLEPKKPLHEQDLGKMCHLRYIDPITLKTKSLTKEYEQPEGTVYWTELYDLPYNVAYGHMVHSLSKPKIEKGIKGQILVGLDTGSCFNGCLSAYILETGEVVSVKAHKQYAPINRISSND